MRSLTIQIGPLHTFMAEPFDEWLCLRTREIIYYLMPKLWKQEVWSKRLMNIRFWVATLGIVLYHRNVDSRSYSAACRTLLKLTALFSIQILFKKPLPS